MGRSGLCSGAMLLALATLAGAGPPKTPWYSRLNPFRKADAAAKQMPRDTVMVESPAAAGARARAAREKADWLRRIAVCTQLHDIALETNDEELRRQAERLNTRAWELYMIRLDTSLAGRPTPMTEAAARGPTVDDSHGGRSPSGPRARGAEQD